MGKILIIKGADFSEYAIGSLDRCQKPNIHLIYDNGFKAQITNSEDTQSYYTINGDDPTELSSLYVSPFSVANNDVVKSISTEEGKLNSKVSSTTVEYETRELCWVNLNANTGNVDYVNNPNSYSRLSVREHIDKDKSFVSTSDDTKMGIFAYNGDEFIGFSGVSITKIYCVNIQKDTIISVEGLLNSTTFSIQSDGSPVDVTDLVRNTCTSVQIVYDNKSASNLNNVIHII